MHKVKKRRKKANIIIETNKAISWVKSSINDGLNKQSNLLGKINPKCTLLPAQIGLFWTQCFYSMQSLFIIVLREIKADGRKIHSIFFLILQKSKDNFFIVYVHK